MNKDEYKKVCKAFDTYYEEYKNNNKDIILKYNHSYNVANYMEELAERLNLDDDDKYLAKTIGLLHDIGRFEQLREHNSYDDNLFDHANFACEYLFDKGHIRDFIEDNTNDIIIKEAIYNHNKFNIRDGLNDKELLYAKMIRDTDKIDILFQVATKFKLTFIDKPNSSIIEDILDGKSIDNKYVKNKSDSVLSTLAFVNDINFKESFDILKESDNLGLYISMVEISKENENIFNDIVNYCNKMIDDNISYKNV